MVWMRSATPRRNGACLDRARQSAKQAENAFAREQQRREEAAARTLEAERRMLRETQQTVQHLEREPSRITGGGGHRTRTSPRQRRSTAGGAESARLGDSRGGIAEGFQLGFEFRDLRLGELLVSYRL